MNRESAKSWFETGDYPTQAQFAQLFEWLLFKDEGIAMADVAGLVAALAGKVDIASFNALTARLVPTVLNITANATFNLPMGLGLAEIGFLATSTMTIRIGTTNGGQEIMEDVELSAGSYLEYQTPMAYANGADLPIYINGVTGNLKVIIFKK